MHQQTNCRRGQEIWIEHIQMHEQINQQVAVRSDPRACISLRLPPPLPSRLLLVHTSAVAAAAAATHRLRCGYSCYGEIKLKKDIWKLLMRFLKAGDN